MAILSTHQVVIPAFNGIDRDAMTNTFHVIVQDNDFATATPIVVAALKSFYEDAYATISTNPTASNSYVWANAEVKSYDLSTPTPRIPTVTALGASITAGPATMPNEFAIVLSYQTTLSPGVPSARRRGRIFLGGWTQQAMTAGSGSAWPQVNATKITQIAAAASNLQNVLNPLDNEQWAQVSRAAGGGLSAASPVIGGFVDNAPDTQRRRGNDATARTTWS